MPTIEPRENEGFTIDVTACLLVSWVELVVLSVQMLQESIAHLSRAK